MAHEQCTCTACHGWLLSTARLLLRDLKAIDPEVGLVVELLSLFIRAEGADVGGTEVGIVDGFRFAMCSSC